MTLASDLAKTEMPAIAEFYLVQQGSVTERYTSYPTSLTFLSALWTATSIKRGRLNRSTDNVSSSLSIKIPLTDIIAKHIPNQPIEPVKVTIYRATIEDLNSYAVFFKGKVANVLISDEGLCQVQMNSNATLFKRRIPNILYQSHCNWDVFDEGCTLDNSQWVRTAQVSTLEDNGATINYTLIDGGGTPDVGYFNVGYIELDTDFRLVTSNDTTSQVTIHVPFDSRMGVGTVFKIYPGCDGDPVTCKNTFDNRRHFMGMKYIPTTNPVIWGFKK